MRTRLTLCVIAREGEVLLGMKKRGFGEGKWNGFGGKVEEGESIQDAASREVQEEAGIALLNLVQRGVLEFSFKDSPHVFEVHVFYASWNGEEPIETEEMRPCWFLVSAIPFDAMWPDDRFWLPLVLAGKSVHGSFFFGDQNTLLSYSLQENSEGL